MAERKEKDMENIETIKDFIWGTDYYNEFLKSKTQKTCLICGRKVAEFGSEKARKRYNLTALCESCQRTNIK